MALQVIEIMPGKLLYRCDACSFEYPKDPVSKCVAIRSRRFWRTVKRKLDPMRIVEIANKRYLYRCEACGAESPEVLVLLENLGLAPAHDCPKGHSDVREIDEREN